MSYSPVAMFVYNRADHFAQTYQALARCPEAKETDLFIFSDGAKNEQAADGVNEVRFAVDKAAAKGDFKNVTVIKSPANKGLAGSIIDGVTDVINRFGTIIVIEDDCVASPHLLTFMNRCLEAYREEKTVGSVAGYTPRLNLLQYEHDVFFARRSCSCCWATWADRWKNVDWSMGWMKDFYANPSLVRALNSNGNDRFMRLYRQSKRDSQSWSIRFGAHHVINNYLVVYPKYSYIKNIGCDESGVHSKAEDAKAMEVELASAIANPKTVKPFLDKNVQKKLYRFYSGNPISASKRSLATQCVILKERLNNGK